MDISSIISGMRPLRARMHLNRILDYLLIGTITGAVLVFFLQAALLFFPIAVPGISRSNLSYLLMGVPAAASFLISLILRPTVHETAETGDSLGLKERLLTAMELSEDMNPIARMQRYDALKQLEVTDFKKLYHLTLDWKKASVSLLVLLLAAGVSFIPSPSRDRADKQEKFFTDIKKQAEIIAVERDKLSENKALTSRQAKEIDKKLMELQKDLLKAKSESDAVKAMNKAKDELRQIENQEKQLKSLGEKLAGHPDTQALGEKLKEGDLKQIEEDLKQLNDRIKKMSAEEREAFTEFLKNAAEQLKNDPQLAQKIQDLSSALAAGNLGALSSQLSQLSSSLAELAAADASLAQALSSLQSSIQGSLQQSGGQQATGSQQAAAGSQQAAVHQQGTGNQQASGNSVQNGQGSGQSGQGGQNGQGTQNGQGGQSGGSQGSQGGAGAGSGTSNANLPYWDINGAQGGRQSPADKQVKDYEKIYSPSHLGGDSEASNVSGQKGTQGESEFRERDQGSGIIGEPVPYNQVYGQYKSEAMQNIQEGEVAPSMRKIVEDYFTSLE